MGNKKGETTKGEKERARVKSMQALDFRCAGMSFAEIANQLGVSRSTAFNYVQRDSRRDGQGERVQDRGAPGAREQEARHAVDEGVSERVQGETESERHGVDDGRFREGPERLSPDQRQAGQA